MAVTPTWPTTSAAALITSSSMSTKDTQNRLAIHRFLLGAEARWSRARLSGRRRRPIDSIHSAQRPCFQHPRLPGSVLAASKHHHARPQLSLDADDSRRRQRRYYPRQGERFTKNLWTERTSAAKPQLVSVRDEADQARFIVERILENRESGTLLKEQAVLFRDIEPIVVRSKSNLTRQKHPVREVWRPEVSRRRPHQGHVGIVALCREPAGSCRGFPASTFAARRRVCHRTAGA